jgi:hypothetical protein
MSDTTPAQILEVCEELNRILLEAVKRSSEPGKDVGALVGTLAGIAYTQNQFIGELAEMISATPSPTSTQQMKSFLGLRPIADHPAVVGKPITGRTIWLIAGNYAEACRYAEEYRLGKQGPDWCYASVNNIHGHKIYAENTRYIGSWRDRKDLGEVSAALTIASLGA